MKTIKSLLFITFIGLTLPVMAQTGNPAAFHGAQPTKAHYYAAYQLNTDDSTKILGTLKNIQNAINDPRLKGKIDVELVVHGSGVVVFRKDHSYEKMIADLQKQGVILAMCENTMRALKLSRDQLFPFISYVPSGNGELIIREQEGWAVIHP